MDFVAGVIGVVGGFGLLFLYIGLMSWFLEGMPSREERAKARRWEQARRETEHKRRDALSPEERRAEDDAYDRWLAARDPRGSA